MNKIIRFLSGLGLTFMLSVSVWGAPLVIDHEAVDHFNDIPDAYIAEVKKMWLAIPGESHSSGYRLGCQLLQAQDTRFQVSILEGGTPEGYTDQHLRLSRASWGDVGGNNSWNYDYGEEDWYTSNTAVDHTKVSLQHCWMVGLTLTATGFGWCWDMTWTNAPGGTVDPVYQVRWAGSSNNGPDGNQRWGLDAGDQTLTGNSVCMDTYLNATAEYISYCASQVIPTKVFYTTGPVDGGENTGENGYQRSLKHERIRNAVNATTDGILFDYADILCWSNAGVEHTTSWTDGVAVNHTYQNIHSDNMLDLDGTYTEDGDHIGQRGALRLGKAVWWMLARMAGWDGVSGATTRTPTSTRSMTATRTVSPTATPSLTATPSVTRSVTGTGTPTVTPTLTQSLTSTQSFTPTISPTGSPTPTVTSTASISLTPTISPTGSPTPRVTHTATECLTIANTSTLTPATVNSVVRRSMQVFPNPARNTVRFSINIENPGEIEIKIYNLAGEKIATLRHNLSIRDGFVEWDCSQVASGIYIAWIQSDQVQQSIRFAIMK